MSGALVHADHLAGVLDLQARAIDTRMEGNQFFEDGSLADKDQMKRGEFNQTGDAGWNNEMGTEVPTHCIDSDQSGQGLLVGALVDHFTAAVETFRRHVVTQVNFTGALLDGQSVGLESVVRTAHVAGGTGFFVLLNSHN